jgi:hypothetical protein
MDNNPKGSDMEKIEKLRKELIVHESDPFKPFFEITKSARESQKAEEARRKPLKRKRSRIGKLGWGLLLLLVAGLSWGGYKYFSYRKASQFRQAAEKQEISKMAARYNASSAWREKLEPFDQPRINDVRETLTKDNRPLLLSVYIPHVAGAGKEDQVHFAEFGSPDPEIDFVLECTSQQVSKLRQQFRSDDGTEFAVIAAISSVEETGFDESPFRATGRCLDFLIVKY